MFKFVSNKKIDKFKFVKSEGVGNTMPSDLHNDDLFSLVNNQNGLRYRRSRVIRYRPEFNEWVFNESL